MIAKNLISNYVTFFPFINKLIIFKLLIVTLILYSINVMLLFVLYIKQKCAYTKLKGEGYETICKSAKSRGEV